MVAGFERTLRKTRNRGVRFIRRNIRVVREDTSTFLGAYNIFMITIILWLSLWTVGWTDPILEILPSETESYFQESVPKTGKLLVLFTAVYVLTSFNQMREARKNRRNYEGSPLLPYFENDDEWGFKVPKLRNFGASPAVMFQLLAQIEGNDGKCEEVLRIESSDNPVNLNPEQSITLMNDELADLLENSEGWSEDADLKLYYGFDSIHAGASSHAPGLSKSLGDLELEHPNPKSMKIQELREYFDERRTESPDEEQSIGFVSGDKDSRH